MTTETVLERWGYIRTGEDEWMHPDDHYARYTTARAHKKVNHETHTALAQTRAGLFGLVGAPDSPEEAIDTVFEYIDTVFARLNWAPPREEQGHEGVGF